MANSIETICLASEGHAKAERTGVQPVQRYANGNLEAANQGKGMRQMGVVTAFRTIPPTNLSCQCEAEALPELHRAHSFKRALAPCRVVPDDVAVDAFSSSLRVTLSHLRFLNISVFRSWSCP